MNINGNRAVAYFDILGFKSKIDNCTLETLSEDYERIISYTDGQFSVENGEIIQRKVCHRYIFSDSIFLIAEEDTEDSFVDMLSYAWRMMQTFIASGFPLRGAVTYGEVYVNLERNVFLGKAISDAAVLEGKQDWIGAIVDSSVIERYKSVIAREDICGTVLSVLLPIYEVPLKDGTRQERCVLNWRLNIVAQDGIKSLFKNEPYSYEAQRKIDNTLCFSKEIRAANIAYLSGERLPQRYQLFYIGHDAPADNRIPFQHGDEY